MWRKPGWKPGGSNSSDSTKKKKVQPPSTDWRASNINEPVPWEVVARVRHGSQGGWTKDWLKPRGPKYPEAHTSPTNIPLHGAWWTIFFFRWTIFARGEERPLNTGRLKTCLQVLSLACHSIIMGTCFIVISICRVLLYKEESRTLVFNLKYSISQEKYV